MNRQSGEPHTTGEIPGLYEFLHNMGNPKVFIPGLCRCGFISVLLCCYCALVSVRIIEESLHVGAIGTGCLPFSHRSHTLVRSQLLTACLVCF
jgi:hypothetical protein